MANIGITLRSARIQRGLTIEQVAQDTRISSRFLEALESEAFEELPAPVYVRGFLRSYANYLRLDALPLLEQLDPAMGGGGAAAAAATNEPQARRPDPFRPATPLPPPVIPARPPLIDDTGDDDLELVGVGADPFSARRRETETPLDAAYDRPYRRERTGGVLMERGAVYDDSGRVARIVALGAGGLILLLVFAGVAFALSGGGGDDDDDDTAQGAGAGSTPGAGGTGTIVVGRTGTPTRSPTVSATSGSGSGSTTPAPTQTPGGPTATPTSESPATATATATAIPSTPTATQPPPAPTATPVPPTPTPTMVPPPAHGSAFSECPVSGGQPQCDWPTAVVCPPGDWFVDYGNDFPAATYGWPSRVASSNSDAINAGLGGCT